MHFTLDERFFPPFVQAEVYEAAMKQVPAGRIAIRVHYATQLTSKLQMCKWKNKITIWNIIKLLIFSVILSNITYLLYTSLYECTKDESLHIVTYNFLLNYSYNGSSFCISLVYRNKNWPLAVQNKK